MLLNEIDRCEGNLVNLYLLALIPVKILFFILTIFILGLSGKEFCTGREKGAFSLTAGAGQYMFYCFPATYGTPTFNVGGFDGGFELAATIDFTNASGNTTSFVIWKSENANLGTQSIIVK